MPFDFQIGAGPAGLVSAISLALNGINVRIVDKSHEYHIGSRGFGIQVRVCPLDLMFLLLLWA